jgi:hypothetical protein
MTYSAPVTPSSAQVFHAWPQHHSHDALYGGGREPVLQNRNHLCWTPAVLRYLSKCTALTSVHELFPHFERRHTPASQNQIWRHLFPRIQDPSRTSRSAHIIHRCQFQKCHTAGRAVAGAPASPFTIWLGLAALSPNLTCG